jgi:hypothetical protein
VPHLGNEHRLVEWSSDAEFFHRSINMRETSAQLTRR